MGDKIFQDALATGRANDSLKETLAALADAQLTEPADAAQIAEFLDRERNWLVAPVEPPSRLHAVLGLMQQVESRAAYDVLRQRGLPVLREIFDQWFATTPWDDRRNEDAMFLVKIFAMYAESEDRPRIGRAARIPELADEFLWGPIFAVYTEDHPLYQEVFQVVGNPLPQGFAGVCLLDAANTRSRNGAGPHPFNTPDGHDRLESYLCDADADSSSYAHSAAAALPFMDDPPRGKLLALGLDHGDQRVQLEAAWASASLGSRAGIECLARTCLDWRYSAVAVEYLTELGEINAIPARAKNPEFMAIAEMARWLAHPMEMGRPPDEAELFDRRTLNWPPAGESRDMWIIRYRYHDSDEQEENDEGVGLVGGITFALFGETEPTMTPEDIYALHCCWEMQVEEDRPSPSERSIATGRELLRMAGNKDF